MTNFKDPVTRFGCDPWIQQKPYHSHMSGFLLCLTLSLSSPETQA